MSNLYSLLTGHYARELSPALIAIRDRFIQIKPKLKEKDGDYCYDGRRCSPDEVAWRLGEGPETIEAIKAGEIDDNIEATWHERAAAEYWYRYEKDWGYD